MSEDTQNAAAPATQGNTADARPAGPRTGGDRSGGDRGSGMRPRRTFYKKKVCKFCKNGLEVDYKKPDSLRRFVTERGKILPRRITGTCAKHQRMLTTEVKRSRALALLPYVSK
ncbi:MULTISPECIES: 30S ribosomal protein S18 [unclassified Oceanispirochaeta]|uniref:30S ribosomal protein S18 n=1 Tax=unclassified Oceanispirochaeta TaxID=2635722 RepID=UPI000E091AFE|nr:MULTISPECIES: 30S ribosomal protein S18 [unclassified Oceanispirochaeta]MBF9017214.1 30S ribosomal protein S18 [Oceanispirochaeta sp. M2]NPD73663.1 30S ribosomal protein S18 [Oceanispirochaeta sp. M1]RDG30593.1 30S ribosomal protein S18 [Oceanispirochaeta sp. M1]